MCLSGLAYQPPGLWVSGVLSKLVTLNVPWPAAGVAKGLWQVQGTSAGAGILRVSGAWDPQNALLKRNL